MRMNTFGRNLTACLLLCTTGGSITAKENVASTGTLPSPATDQIAPPPAVLPQDVPQIEIPSATSSPLVPADQDFLAKALAVVTAERELGKLASERGETEEVKALGRELLKSQVKNGAALQELAKLKNFQLKMPLENPQEEILTPLQEKSGTSFDSAFRESVAQDRSKSIQLFTQGAKLAKDPAVRGLAMQALAELKKERPLAAMEAAKTAQNGREISRVAVSSQPEKPPLPNGAKAASAPAVAVAPSSVPPPQAPANPTTISASANGTLRATPAAPSPIAQPSIRPVRSQISDETGVVSRSDIPVVAGQAPASVSVPSSASIQPAPVATSRSTEARTANRLRGLSAPAIQSLTPSSIESAPVATAPRESYPPTSTGNIRYSSPSPVLEGPGTTRSVRPAIRTREAAHPTVVEETQYVEEQPTPKKRATIQEAPRPRVIRRANETVVEENTVPPPAPRKVIRRKLFQFSREEADEDDD